MKKMILHFCLLDKKAAVFAIHALEAAFLNSLLIIMYIYVSIKNGQSAYITCQISKEALQYVFLSAIISLGSALLLDSVIKEQRQKEK